MTSKKTDHDLIVRIDERQSNIMDKMTAINKKLDIVVVNDDEYKELKSKVDSLWDSKNKVLGWLIGAGMAGGFTSTLLQGLVKTVLASIK